MQSPSSVLSDRSRSAALTLPWNIWLANCRDRLALSVAGCPFFGSLCCIVRPSRRSSFRSPSSQLLSRHCRYMACCFALEFFAGFWSSRFGMIVAAFKATDSSADDSPNALKSLANSDTNDLGPAPFKTLKRLILSV